MASVVYIMDKVLYKVLIDGEKLIDKYFMMGIFLCNHEEAAATTKVTRLRVQ